VAKEFRVAGEISVFVKPATVVAWVFGLRHKLPVLVEVAEGRD